MLTNFEINQPTRGNLSMEEKEKKKIIYLKAWTKQNWRPFWNLTNEQWTTKYLMLLFHNEYDIEDSPMSRLPAMDSSGKFV